VESVADAWPLTGFNRRERMPRTAAILTEGRTVTIRYGAERVPTEATITQVRRSTAHSELYAIVHLDVKGHGPMTVLAERATGRNDHFDWRERRRELA
jgi:hypothetical protein